jgi:glycosyltransferase involved in cell wall biosynthesis
VESRSVDVVLPCLNEARALPGVLARLPQSYRTIVVDNGSDDGSPEVAESLGAKVVAEPRRGYGAAIHRGLQCATGEVVCFCDADGSLDPAELPGLVSMLDRGFDLAVGMRRPARADVWPWHARAGNILLAFLLRRKGLAVRDIAPIRAVRRRALLDLEVRDRAFGYPVELLVKAAAAGWRVAEREVAYTERAAGTVSKVSGSARGTARAIRDMAKALR